MLTIKEIIRTLYNALVQKLKNHRGNWEQNDPTADDYIKNRPFYTDENATMDIIPYQSIEIISGRDAAPSGGYTSIFLSPIIPFVAGNTYEITWNDKKYNCIAYDLDGLAVVGDSSFMGGKATDDPFFIVISKDIFGGAYIYAFEVGTHKVGATCMKVVTLDPKYVPTSELGLADVAFSGNYYDLYGIPNVYEDVVRYNSSQGLTAAQKQTARNNIGAITNSDVAGVVKYNETQTLTEAQKTQARTNIGAGTSSFSGSYNDLADLPAIAKDGIVLDDQVNGYRYVACMRNGNLVTYCATKSIEIITMPNKIEYVEGGYFDPSGMTIFATAYDNTSREVVNYTYSTEYLTNDVTSIEIKYNEAGIEHTINIPITVSTFDPVIELIDFKYRSNGDGTYTITEWNGTTNGVASTEIIIPDNAFIVV